MDATVTNQVRRQIVRRKAPRKPMLRLLIAPLPCSAALAALGIVYGDLGTSPLYTYQTIVGTVGGHPSAEDALGLLSLVVWALIITVSIKYCIFVMRADNNGEGGILALMALVTGRRAIQRGAGRCRPVRRGADLWRWDHHAGDFGPERAGRRQRRYRRIQALCAARRAGRPAALFGAQTKGTAQHRPRLWPDHAAVVRRHRRHWSVRRNATAGCAVRHRSAACGPLGRSTMAGIRSSCLAACSWRSPVAKRCMPTWGISAAFRSGRPGTAWCCRRCCCATPGRPLCCWKIRAWTAIRSSSLLPHWAVVPLVVLATCATIIASQAIITGAFSLTRQAMQLGWFPGLNIRQTSDQEYGQIYVPVVNWTMMVCTLVLTFSFGSSDRLAGAYGTAVSTTMLLTTALLFNAMRDVWRWPLFVAVLVSGFCSC